MNKYFISGALALTLVLTPAFGIAAKVHAAQTEKNSRPSLWSRILSRFNDRPAPKVVKPIEPVIVPPETVLPIPEPQVNVLAMVSSNPPSGAVISGQPWSTDGALYGGSKIQIIEVTMSNTATAMVAEDFEVTSPNPDTPRVVSLMPSEKNNTVKLVLQYPLPLGVWTTITHKASGSKIVLGRLPGDVNQDGAFTPHDILKMVDYQNGVADLPLYAVDMDNSEAFTPADFLRLIDLINGADKLDPVGEARWFGRSLGPNPLTSQPTAN